MDPRADDPESPISGHWVHDHFRLPHRHHPHQPGPRPDQGAPADRQGAPAADRPRGLRGLYSTCGACPRPTTTCSSSSAPPLSGRRSARWPARSPRSAGPTTVRSGPRPDWPPRRCGSSAPAGAWPSSSTPATAAERSIAHFSATHGITSATAWTAALILMALSEATMRTSILGWRFYRLGGGAAVAPSAPSATPAPAPSRPVSFPPVRTRVPVSAGTRDHDGQQ